MCDVIPILNIEVVVDVGYFGIIKYLHINYSLTSSMKGFNNYRYL